MNTLEKCAEEFNKYCADVMNYNYEVESAYCYEPYDDLNQMAEVVEKLIQTDEVLFPQTSNMGFSIRRDSVKQAFRDFIISTKEKE